MVEAEDEGRSPVASRLLAPVRFLLHWIIKIVVLFFLAIRFALRPKPIRYGAIAIVALFVASAIFGWNLIPFSQPAPPQQANVAAISTSASPIAAPIPQSPVVERYLAAQANFDANAMWEGLSDELKSDMQQSSITLEQLQLELNAARDQGRRFRNALYIGGAPMNGNRTAYFYVLTVDGPPGPSDVPYIYVVGNDGKIVSIQ